MKRKDYEKPTMEAVTLLQLTPLLAGSDVGGTLDGGWTDDDGDAWGGGGSSGGDGGSLGGGWDDDGGDAWE